MGGGEAVEGAESFAEVVVGGLERVGFAAKARVEIVQRGEVCVGEGALAEGSCEVDEERLGGAGLLVEAAGAGADGVT